MSRVAALISAKEVRDNRQYRQKEIADQTGLTESTLSRMVNGVGLKAVGLGKAIALADWLGVDVKDLYEVTTGDEPEREHA